MISRLPVFIGALAVGLGLTWYGGVGFQALLAALWLGLLSETSLAASVAVGLPHRKYLWIDLAVFGTFPVAFLYGGLFGFLALTFVWFFILFLFYPTNRDGLSRWMFSTVVQPYFALGVLSFYLLRQTHWLWAMCAIAIVAVADTGAYLVGRAFGRNLLAPSVSPSKTMEGAAAGVILATLAGAAILTRVDVPVKIAAPVCASLAVLAVLGDLFESFLKRGLGIKDFGSSLPGHGGLFDRLDSILPVSIGMLIFLRWWLV